MTGRTTPTSDLEHGLTLLVGGLTGSTSRPHDEPVPELDAAWLAREIAEAASLCDQLEAEGRRIAIEPRGNGERGVAASIRDLAHDRLVRELDTRDLVDVDRLIQLNGMGG